MPDGFTQRARRVMKLADDIGRRAGADPSDDLPILIAILEDDGGIAAEVLRELGVQLEPLYKQLPSRVSIEDSSASAPAPAEPIAARAAAVARELGAAEAGTEHLLIALTRGAGTNASQALSAARVSEARVKATAHRLGFGEEPPPPPPPDEVTRRRIRDVLLADWDPHDLARHPAAAATAYDAYIEPLWLLIQAHDEDAIVAFLRDRERESMCFPGLDTRRLRRPARKLLALGNTSV